MRSLTQYISPSQATAPAVSVRSTIIYVAVSVGILLVGLLLITMLLFVWLRPRQRDIEAHRQRNLRLQGIKAEEEVFRPQIRPFPVIVMHPGDADVVFAVGEEWAAIDAADAKLMTTNLSTESEGLTHLSYGDTSGEMDESQGLPRCASHQSVMSSFFTPRGSAASSELVEGGVTTTRNQQGDCRGSILASVSSPEELIVFNPLTHFVTERQPQLFVAEVTYPTDEEQRQRKEQGID